MHFKQLRTDVQGLFHELHPSHLSECPPECECVSATPLDGTGLLLPFRCCHSQVFTRHFTCSQCLALKSV